MTIIYVIVMLRAGDLSLLTFYEVPSPSAENDNNKMQE